MAIMKNDGCIKYKHIFIFVINISISFPCNYFASLLSTSYGLIAWYEFVAVVSLNSCFFAIYNVS